MRVMRRDVPWLGRLLHRLWHRGGVVSVLDLRRRCAAPMGAAVVTPASAPTRRGSRRPYARTRLMARDSDALELLAWAGVLSTSHFVPLVYPSRRVAQRRLRALLDHGLVRAKVRHGALHRDTVLALSHAGVEFLEESRGLVDVRTAAFPRAQKTEHSLAIRRVFVAFLDHARRAGLAIDDVAFETDDGLPGLAVEHLVPDLVVRPQAGSGVVLVEVDLGHERRRVLVEKLSRYERFLSTAPDVWLLFAATSERRVAWVSARFVDVRSNVVCVSLDGIAAGIARCSPGVFAPVVRAARTGAASERIVSPVVSDCPSVAFRVVRRSP